MGERRRERGGGKNGGGRMEKKICGNFDANG